MTVERYMRVGRPKSHKEKSKMLSVRLAPDDISAIKKLAQKFGVSVTALLEGIAEGRYRVVRGNSPSVISEGSEETR